VIVAGPQKKKNKKTKKKQILLGLEKSRLYYFNIVVAIAGSDTLVKPHRKYPLSKKFSEKMQLIKFSCNDFPAALLFLHKK